jgi:Tfp pilus assembly protein PilX
MNKKLNPDRALIYFMLRAQQIAQQDGRSDKGYAMLMVSMISIALFSMLAAYMTMTNLNKSSTSAYVDGTNTFYVAESGLNQRAQQLRNKFINYSLPGGLSPGQANINAYVSPTNITNCFAVASNLAASATNDFECRNFAYQHTDSSNASVKNNSNGSSETTTTNRSVGYNAYTFVADRTNYIPASNPRAPRPVVIPAAQVYAGLNAMEYWYTVYSTAAKPDPLNPTNPLQQSNAKTVLQMDFKSRVVPLFQFAVFYDGDLEMNSSSNMTIGGRVHTNSNFYVQPNTSSAAVITTFLSPITAVGSIYNRVDAGGGATGGTVRMCNPTCVTFPAVGASTNPTGRATDRPLSAGELTNYFGANVQSGIYSPQLKRLQTPPPGFLRKRNYFKSLTTTDGSHVGAYFAKADMRLEMVPDRDVTSTAATPWTRLTDRIPFNFTSVTTVAGLGSTCTTTAPATDTLASGIPSPASDPLANYIDPDRNNPNTAQALTTSLHCNLFTKGQLQSLRQPVIVLTSIKQTAALTAQEGTILGKPATLPTAPASLSGTVTATIAPGTPPNATQQAILRALQVAISSNPTPIALDSLNAPFSSNPNLQTEFLRLLTLLPTTTLSVADRNLLTANAVTPNQIAAIGGAWFMPAPIQRIETNNLQDGANNPRRSGFYDGRERRWVAMLQTNIASLSVWNRDGLYVESADTATDTTVTAPYLANTMTKNAAFNLGVGANSTDGLAFDRAATIPATATAKGLQVLGLGARDGLDPNATTEGGLVFHATVRDDLNGDGTLAAASDTTLDIANPIKKRDAVGNLIDADGKTMAAPGLTIDYPRKYRNGSTLQSSFGFAFNGGNYLPGPLTLATDQAIYIQGDFNNNGAPQPAAAINTPDPNRLPASIIGDTITILSNQCLSLSSINATTGTRYNDLLVPMSQISCGIPNSVEISGFTNLAGAVTNNTNFANGFIYRVAGPTAVNAAFLSNTKVSNGNLPSAALATPTNASRGFGTTNQFSGALNNYMRMLEDWGGAGGQYFNYSGSFVSLGTPLEYSGNYIGGGTYYMIPVRNFNFDSFFNTFNLLPPLPPTAIYLKQDVFKRTYN